MTAQLPHQAIGGAMPIVAPANMLILVMAYVVPLIILVVLGIWGFRLGSQGSSGNSGGGGPKRPEPTPSPPGGRESGDERGLSSLTVGSPFELPGQEEQAQQRERELVGPRP